MFAIKASIDKDTPKVLNGYIRPPRGVGIQFADYGKDTNDVRALPMGLPNSAAAYFCVGCLYQPSFEGPHPMKYLIFSICFALASQLVYSQNVAHGYLITQSNDTVDVRIKVPKTIFADVDIETFQRRMDVAVDSTCNFKKYGPDEIKGYGFYYRNVDYNFVAKHVKGTSRFFRKVFIGNNSTMYVYSNASGFIGTTFYTYIVSARNSNDLVLENTLSRKQIKTLLKSYFHGNEAAQIIIDENPISRQNMGSSIQEIISLVDYTIEPPAVAPVIAPVVGPVNSPGVGPTLVLRR